MRTASTSNTNKYEGAFILEYGMLTQACRYSEEPKPSDDEGTLQINDKLYLKGTKHNDVE